MTFADDNERLLYEVTKRLNDLEETKNLNENQFKLNEEFQNKCIFTKNIGNQDTTDIVREKFKVPNINKKMYPSSIGSEITLSQYMIQSNKDEHIDSSNILNSSDLKKHDIDKTYYDIKVFKQNKVGNMKIEKEFQSASCKFIKNEDMYFLYLKVPGDEQNYLIKCCNNENLIFLEKENSNFMICRREAIFRSDNSYIQIVLKFKDKNDSHECYETLLYLST
uniref:Major sperm protein n=1 Tax=Parastrongyloides trichosuri TaxID=131310 RepID=A0A0N4ZR89_PARTI